MAENRYRRGSPPPGARRYNDPRSSTGAFFSSSFDPTYSRGSIAPYPQTRHGSIYDTQPTKKYSYQDSSLGPTLSSTHYAVRPRENSSVATDHRRPLSMVVKNTSPTRSRPLVSNSSRETPRSSVVGPLPSRDESSRYLVPASSHGREHHQRHYSATRADIERLNGSVRNGRPRQDYHPSGGYSSAKAYPASRLKEDDFSYTGPREQFARDYPSRPTERRDSQTRRERPASVYDLGGYKDAAIARRDLGPPPAASTRQLDRLERSDGGRQSLRPAYESEPERGGDLPQRRHSVRAPVVHQVRDDDYKEYRPRDDADMRPLPRPRRDRIEEEELPIRPRRERSDEDDVQLRPKRERVPEVDASLRPRRERIPDEDTLVRPRRERIEEDVPVRPRRERLDEDDLAPPRPRRERMEEEEVVPKPRVRDPDHDLDRDREIPKERDRIRDRNYERDPEREREKDRPKPVEKSHKHIDDKREGHSRDNSLEDSGRGKAVAAGLGSLAAAGLAGAAIKGASKPEDASDSETRKERRHRKHRHRDRDAEPDPRSYDQTADRKVPVVAENAVDEGRHGLRQDESASESLDEDRERRRPRRHKHRDREAADVDGAFDPRAAQDPVRPERDALEVEDEPRRRRRHSRVREPDSIDLERRTISPGEEEDDRPRRVQLVEPVRDKEEVKPRGILKAPRSVPFPEDPNPTREGVAPLKEAGKDGVPQNARWTKISRVLVNPEALEKAHERFEERDDYVIVLRVVTREEIEKLATKTKEIRETREREWQEELEKRPPQTASMQRNHDRRPASEEEEGRRQPMLDQVPANPSFDPRAFANPGGMANHSVPAMPVPHIKLEPVEAPVYPPTYSTNV